MHRRYFIKSVAAAGALFSFPIFAAPTDPAAPVRPRRMDEFSAALKSKFTAALKEDKKAVLVLTDVRAIAKSKRTESFELNFESDSQPPLKQGSYTFANDKLGTVEIFIVPGKATPAGHTYKAVFNNLLS